MDLDILKAQWDAVCDLYAESFCEMYGFSMAYCWWAAEERGGVFVMEDGALSLGMDDLTYAVNHRVSKVEFTEWMDYLMEPDTFDALSLRQWCRMKRISEIP